MKKNYLLFFVASIALWVGMIILAVAKLPSQLTVTSAVPTTSKLPTAKSIGDLYFLFALSITLIIGMFSLTFFPEKMNYPYQLTEQNKKTAFRRIKLLLGVSCLATTLILMFIAFQAISAFKINNNTSIIVIAMVSTVGLPLIIALLLREGTDDTSKSN